VFAQYFEAENNGAAMKGLDDSVSDPRKLRQDSPSVYELSSEIFAGIFNTDLGLQTSRFLQACKRMIFM
jgi:hypothetical protein